MAFWRRRSQKDFEAEVQAHLALEADERIARGADAADARDEARRAFGNVTRATERYYESRRPAAFATAVRNLRYALRTLRRNPGFTIAAIGTLAFGVGVNTSVFAFLYTLSARPLPVRDADQLVSVFRDYRGRFTRETRGSVFSLSYPEYADYRDRNRTLAGLSVYTAERFALDLGEPISVEGQLVSCDYLQTLSVRMARGRGFARDECTHPGSGPVVVLSHGFWQRQFGGDSSIVGRTVSLNRTPMTIIGIAEPEFDGIALRAASLWTPITMHTALTHGRDSILVRESSWLTMVARLKPGVTAADAQVDLAIIASRREGAEVKKPVVYVNAASYTSAPTLSRSRMTTLVTIGAAAMLVLLMACANVMNLLLARAAARRREIAIRLSLGASRRQLVAQLMTESATLAFLGGALSVPLAYVLPSLMFAATQGPGQRADFSPNVIVFAYALVASALAMLVFGLAPALQGTRFRLTSAMRSEGAGAGLRAAASRTRSAVVAVQVAGSALFLVLAGLLVRSITHAQRLDPGFSVEPIVALSLDLARAGYDGPRAEALFDRLRERVGGLRGVESVALARDLPLAVGYGNSIVIDAPDAIGEPPNGHALMNSVSAEYFPTMGIPIVQGRAPTPTESRVTSEIPVVVSEAMSRRYWPTTGAVGKRFHIGDTRWIVTGVARDVRNISLDQVDRIFVYEPANPDDLVRMQLIVRAASSPTPLIPLISEIVRQADPTVIHTVAPYRATLDRVIRPAITLAWLSASMGALAALLAIIGVYGVVNFSVSQRAREFGVRIALGASSREIFGLVMRQGIVLIVIGLVIGTLMAISGSQLIRNMLFGIDLLDPIAYGTMAALLVAAGLMAMLGPARRATKVDPATTLRAD
jgi:predicted permease